MIPIFIITCDRLEVLKESIRSYHAYIKTPFEIVIIDFGSTYEPTIEYLKELEFINIKVYWRKRIRASKGLNGIDDNIKDYFTTHPASNYVVTDSDVALDNVNGDILEVYTHLLDKLPRVDVVGSMLRINDIPDYYPNKEELIKWETQYYSKIKHEIQYENKCIQYVVATIDSTFGMNRKGKHWERYAKKAVRVLPPYAAIHLDWYLDPKNLKSDQKYYLEHASRQIVHWSVWR